MTRALLVAATCLLCSCFPVPAYVADGGHTNGGCFNGMMRTFSLKVIDSNGNPVPSATVNAINKGSGKTVSGTTDARGISLAVTEDIGAGYVDITATEGARKSDVFTTEWNCGECDCLA